MGAAITLLAAAIIITNITLYIEASKIRHLQDHNFDVLICLSTIIHKIEHLEKANKTAKKSSTKKEK